MAAPTHEMGITTVIPAGTDADALPVRSSVIERLRAAAGRVEPWHLALLRAVGEWDLAEETLGGRRWRYVIGGEALDWLTLAERLCLEIPDVVPIDELEDLLFRGVLPEPVGGEELRQLIGPYRHTAYLNFWYGVVVEEALQLVIEEGIRKSRLARCYGDSDDVVDESYRHLYGETRVELVSQFLGEANGIWGLDRESLSFAAWQEFTYWLFKKRIRKWHPARIASDTRRGLDRLRELRRDGLVGNPGSPFVADNAEPIPLLSGR